VDTGVAELVRSIYELHEVVHNGGSFSQYDVEVFFEPNALSNYERALRDVTDRFPPS
jgi:Cu/Ag efflux pump CusA